MSLPAPEPGRPVAITGASAGIGEALARALAERGHDLVLIARRKRRLSALARELREAHGVEVAVRPADLADAASRRQLGDELAAQPLAGLCNNAGTGRFGRFQELTPAEVGEIVELNAAALGELTAAVVPGMIERGEGAVLQVASILGHGPQPHSAVYGATKAFVIALGEAVHQELAGTGVSCTVVSPGPVQTELLAATGPEGLGELTPGLLWQTPEDVAEAAVKGMEDGARTVIPGVTNRIATTAGRFVPRTLALPVQNAVGAALPALRRRLNGD